jgi:hypothetical protein|tara:strand:+ start:73 stop:258 length:186 start_codon:yes stop_codon:yes gene_type:complete
MLFIFSHCSIDTKSGLWENKNIMNNDKKLSEIDFNKKLTFFEFKENVILYSKKSKFPVITK